MPAVPRPLRSRASSPPWKGPARLLRVPLDWTLEPERAALLVRGDDRPFALAGCWAGGRALVGSQPVRVARAGEDPFALLDEQPHVLDGDGDGAAVGGGWVGVLGFALGGRVERLAPAPPRPVPAPAHRLAFYDHLLRLDADGRWWFEALQTPARAADLGRRLAVLQSRAESPPAPGRFSTAPWRAIPGAAGHALAVEACRERIAAGDLFQASLCQRLESTLDGDALDVFAAASAALRPERAAYLAGPWGAVASLSPELFLRRRGRAVLSAPIKGTRPRPAGAAAAAALRDELARSEKDRAENVMIVDLVRNDLGRVCAPGSVRVAALCEPRAHTGVWHLVSEVEGRLREGVGDGDLVRAAFPPGSVTGAPKVAALDVIAELESTGREAYTGAIGFAGPLAGLELNVAIRTFEVHGERIWLGVGGGVVADSDPAAEAAEAATKAAPLLAAIGARAPVEGPPARAAAGGAAPAVGAAPPRPAAAPRPLRLAPRPTPRPDPAAGVFTTVLARDGGAVDAEAHLARLAASARALYDAPLPATAAGVLHAAAAAAPDPGRVRLDLRPTPRGLAVQATASNLPAPAALELRPVAVPGGLGAHKWADRRLLDALAAATAPAVPLLVDLDGLVLEAAWANVLAILDDGTTVTPPLDGRILPGTTRARVVAAGGVHERPLALAELLAAREVLLTSALRGVVPATVRTG